MNTSKTAAIRTPASLTLLCASLLWGTAVHAGLKEKPPKGFDGESAGVWQIDATRSDEPKAILDKAREKMAASRGASGNPGRGGYGGGDGGPGGPGGGGPGGGGPGGGRRGGGGGGHRGDGGSFPQGGPSPDGRPGGENASGRVLDELAHSPGTLTLGRNDQRVKILLDETSSTCTAGTPAAISDSTGSGERRCGWSGSAWVVETTRGKDFKRTDRYEAARDGKTLTYVTTVSSARMPAITISRTYTRSSQ